MLGPLDEFLAGGPHSKSDGSNREVRDPLEFVGTDVGHYRIKRFLGEGGMGVVYEARDTQLDRRVALKFLPRHVGRDEEARARFLREARAASKLDHANICTVHEIGETPSGQLFIAMAFYDGETLKRRIARGPLDPDEAIRYAAQIARGLSASHASGIIHRDIKPANILLAPTVSGDTDAKVKILDFGLAKNLEESGTGTTGIRGTPDYMSPEQAQGEELDHRTDIWSLGVVLYEMLSGQRPFRARNEHAIIFSILHRKPRALSRVRPELGRDLEHIISMCLERDRALRYQSADELAADLKAATKPSVSGPSTGLRRRRTRRRVRRWGAAATLGVVLAIAVALARDVLVSERRSSLDLAVLPLTFLGGDQPQDEAFALGLVHIVTNTLTDMARFDDRLSVVPASLVVEDTVTTTSVAVARFGVDHTIEGTLQMGSDAVRLDLVLIDAIEGRQPASRQLRLPRGELASLPDSFVVALTDLLGLETGTDDERSVGAGATRRPGAFQFYTEARGYLRRFEVEANVDLAIERLNDALERDPDFTWAYAALGEAYLLKYRQSPEKDPAWVDLATEYGEAALARDSTLWTAHLTLGEVLTETGQSEEAAEAIKRALKLSPADPFAHRALGVAFQGMGDFASSESSFQTAIDLRPAYWGFHRSLGYLYHVQGRHEDALVAYGEVVALRPDNPAGFNDLGSQYERLGLYDEARNQYRQGASANPEATRSTSYALGNWAGIRFREGDFAEAVRLFERARVVDPANTTAWASFPAALYWAGQGERAQEVWTDIIRLERIRLGVNPNDLSAMGRLADALARTGEGDEALRVLGRMSSGTPEPWILLGMALTYEHLNQRQQALSHLARALENGLTGASLEYQAVWLENLRTTPEYQVLVDRYISPSGGR